MAVCVPLPGALSITVRVRDFELPRTFGMKTGFAMMDGFIRKLYPDRFRAMKRAAWDVMLDHRLNPDDITRTSPPEIEDLLYARSLLAKIIEGARRPLRR